MARVEHLTLDNGATSIMVMNTIIDILAVVGFYAVFFVLPVGLCLWHTERRQAQVGATTKSASHPYRTRTNEQVWRFVRVHRHDAWKCPVCGASTSDDCDAGLHS